MARSGQVEGPPMGLWSQQDLVKVRLRGWMGAEGAAAGLLAWSLLAAAAPCSEGKEDMYVRLCGEGGY